MPRAQSLFDVVEETPALRLHAAMVALLAIASEEIQPGDIRVSRDLVRAPAENWSSKMLQIAARIVRDHERFLLDPCMDLWYLGERSAALAQPRPVAPKPAPPPPPDHVFIEAKQSVYSELFREGPKLAVRLDGYHPDLVLEMRLIKGRRWQADKKLNLFPLAARDALIEFAERHGMAIADEVLETKPRRRDEPDEPDLSATELHDNQVEREASIAASKALDADFEILTMASDQSLMPFQRAGVVYALMKRRTIIGDEMGLGKTVQGLAAVVAANALPAIVVCPNTARLVWARDLAKFFPHLTATIVRGTAPGKIPPADLTIVNYDIVAERSDDLVDVGAQSLIMDEVHWIKNGKMRYTCPQLVVDPKNGKIRPCGLKVRSNAKSCGEDHVFDTPTLGASVKRTGGVFRVGASIPRDGMILGLSGTPVTNDITDLINVLIVLRRIDEFGGAYKFEKRYKEGHNLLELNEHLRARCMVRRTKEDVMKELPKVLPDPVPLEISATNMAVYRQAERDVITYVANRAAELARELAMEMATEMGVELSEVDLDDIAFRAAVHKRLKAQAAEHLIRITALKQAAVEAKREAAFAWLQDFIDSGEDKIIAFAERVDLVEHMTAQFAGRSVKVRGGVSLEDRAAAVDRFQDDPTCRIFVANIAAGKEALTLTAASDVAFLEFGWTPAEIDQCTARCYGRVNDAHGATAHYLIAPGTIEEDVLGLIDYKRKIVDAATDGKESEESTSILGDLLVRLAERGLNQQEALV